MQIVSFTITEKGYALHDISGNYLNYVKSGVENGPSIPIGAMTLVIAMLLERYQYGKLPLTLFSMDNVSERGKKLRNSVIEMDEKWLEKNYVDKNFVEYIKN